MQQLVLLRGGAGTKRIYPEARLFLRVELAAACVQAAAGPRPQHALVAGPGLAGAAVVAALAEAAVLHLQQLANAWPKR